MVSRETSLGEAGDSAGPARALFGERLPLAQRYADLLATVGTERGLIGPREVDRIWDRHLINSAVLGEIVTSGTVADIGSGAGLPGLPLALARPELTVTLIEPLLRRASFLAEVVAELGLPIEVVRARAEELAGTRQFDVVVSRAVAPLPKLLGWCVPLTRPGGRVVALKGERAASEIAAARDVWRRLGLPEPSVVAVGQDGLSEPTWVVEAKVPTTKPRPGPAGKSRRGRRSR